MTRQHVVLGVLTAILVLSLDVVINPEKILGMSVSYPWMYVSPADLALRPGREVVKPEQYDDSYLKEYADLVAKGPDVLGAYDEDVVEDVYEEELEEDYVDDASDTGDDEGEDTEGDGSDDTSDDSGTDDEGGDVETDDGLDEEPIAVAPTAAPPVGGEGAVLPPTPTSVPVPTNAPDPAVAPANTPPASNPTPAQLTTKEKLFLLMQLQQGQ